MKNETCKTLLFVTAMLISIPCSSQDLTDKEILTIENKALVTECSTGCDEETLEKLKKNSSDLESLKGTFKFGVAIGFENFKDEYVNEAKLVGENRIVRVSDSQEFRPSIWLETHYIWDGIAKDWGLDHSAPGFYVGARLLGPDSDVFEAFSLGVLWSFKRTRIDNVPPAGQIAESINIGFGPVWHKTQVLASGIEEGEPLPADYDDIELDRRDEVSWMLTISAGF